MKTHLLIIDDHPTQIDGYKAILTYGDTGRELEFTTAESCQAAFAKITNKQNTALFDVVFLDWSLPPYPEEKLLNGEDVGALVRKHLPKAKIVMMTSHCEAFILHNITRKCNPEGLMVKSDFTAEDLLDAFHAVIAGETYASVTVKEKLKTIAAKSDYLDNHNRKIIQLLAEGVRTKHIPLLVSLSQSAVEKRKASIKDYFGIGKGGDEEHQR